MGKRQLFPNDYVQVAELQRTTKRMFFRKKVSTKVACYERLLKMSKGYAFFSFNHGGSACHVA